MAEKVCANCGAEVPAAAVFCTQCGSRDLSEAPSSTRVDDAPPPPIAPDAPTVPVSDTQEAPSYAAQLGAEAAHRPAIGDAPTTADRFAVDDPTSVSAVPPAPTVPAAPPPAPSVPVPAPPPWDAPTAAHPPTPTQVPTQVRAAASSPTTDRGGRFGAALALLGGAAAIVGAFLEWMKLTPDWADAVSFSGWTLTDDAKVVVVVGAIVVVAAVVVLGGSLRGPMRVLAAVGGIVLLGLGAYDTYDILERLPDALADAGVSGAEIAAPQIGLILVLAGGAVTLLGALTMTRRKESDPTVDPSGTPIPAMPTGTGPGTGAPPAPPAGGYAPPTGSHGAAPDRSGNPPGSFPPAAPPSGGDPPPRAPFGREWS